MSSGNQGHAASAAQNMQDKVSGAVQGMQGTAEQVKRAAQERLNQVRDRAGEYLQEGRDRAMEMERSVEGQIRSQPVQAMLIAAGVGFLLGMLFIRR